MVVLGCVLVNLAIMGSENLILNCNGGGQSSSCIQVCNANALNNIVIGGSYGSVPIAIQVLSGCSLVYQWSSFW